MAEARSQTTANPEPTTAQAQIMSRAVIILAQREAIKAVTRQMRAKGLKIMQIPHKVIVTAADEYLQDHSELIAEAKETVLRWHAEGKFRPRGAVSD
jgi:predicted transcriptional regulator